MTQSDNPAVVASIDKNFRSLHRTMLTLVRYVTMDSLSSFYEPIIAENPWYAIYFFSILLTVSIALLNLVTAVLVEGAMEKSGKDRKEIADSTRQKIKSYLPMARELFHRLDISGDGWLTLDEVKHGLEHQDADPGLCAKLQKVVPFEGILELFESLDIDGDGEISEPEFVEAVLKAGLEEKGDLEFPQVLRLLRIAIRKLDRLESLLRSMDGLEPAVRGISPELT